MSSEPVVPNLASGPTPAFLAPEALPGDTGDVAKGDGKAKSKNTRKEKKLAPSDVRPDTLAKFPWHKYPEATQHLCSIKDQLLKRGPDGKRVRGMAKLKEQARDELLHWWDDHTKESRNKGDMHELIHNFYKNRLQLNDWDKYDGSESANTASTTGAPAAPTQPTRDSAAGAALLEGILAPLLQSFKGRARAASAIWAEEHPEEVEIRKKGMPRQPGMHQRAVAALFGELSEEQQALWQAKADDEKAAIENDPESCFNNQTEFPNVLAVFLDSLIGYGSKQIGSALIDYQLAMRMKDGRIKLHRCTVGLQPDDEPFGEFRGGPSQDENHRWRDFVDVKLAPNPVHRDERFIYAADGLAKLPPYDRTWSTEVAAEVLQAWFEHMWTYARQHSETALPHALDWELISQNGAAFIPPTWLNHGIQDPNEIEFFNMPVIYHRLFEAQDTEAVFRWNSSKVPVRELTAPPAVPATPRRNIRVVFSSPTKATPRQPPPQLSPIPSPRFEPASSKSMDGANSDGAMSTPALDEPTTLANASESILTSHFPETALDGPPAPAAPATVTTVSVSEVVDSPPAHNVDASLATDVIPNPDVTTSNTMDEYGGDASIILAPSDPEGSASEKCIDSTTDMPGLPEAPQDPASAVPSSPVTNSDELEAGARVVGEQATMAKKREATPDPVGAQERPTKRRKSAAPAIAAETEPTRRSSRVRTGAAASVSYRVLGGGKEIVAGSSTAPKGAKPKQGATGKLAASKKRSR